MYYIASKLEAEALIYRFVLRAEISKLIVQWLRSALQSSRHIVDQSPQQG